MMRRAKCQNAVEGRWSILYGLALLAPLLVPLAVGNALGQTDQKEANGTSDDKVIKLAPVDFKDKDKKQPPTQDGKLEIVFMDLGSDVGLVFRSPYNTLLHSNFKHSHRPTNGEDRNYGVDFGDNKVCTWLLGTDSSQCEKPPHLHGFAERKGDKWEVSLRIPKSELSTPLQPGQPDCAWVTVGTFDVSGADPSVIYPLEKHLENQRSKLFEMVYELEYDQSRGTALHPCWLREPRVSGRPENPAYKEVYAGTRVCLTWDFPDAKSVNITDFGSQKAAGRACTDAGSPGTRTFVFKPVGVCPDEETVPVKVKRADILTYIVKGDFLVAHKEYAKALDVYRDGLNQDPDNSDLRDRMRRAEALADQ